MCFFLFFCAGSTLAETACEDRSSPVRTLDFSCTKKKDDSTANKWIQTRITELKDTTGNADAPLISEGLEAISSYKKTQETVSGSVGLTYNGKSGQQVTEEETLSFELNLNWGAYPDQFRSVIKFDFEEDNDTFEESIGKLEVGYDKYLNCVLRGDKKTCFDLGPIAVESFIVGRRTNIDELQIDERWEAGAGLKFEFNSASMKGGFKRRAGRVIQHQLFDIKGGARPFDASDEQLTRNTSLFQELGSVYESSMQAAEIPERIRRNCKAEEDAVNCPKVFAGKLDAALSDFDNKFFRAGFAQAMSAFRFGLSVAVFREFTDASITLVGAKDTPFEDQNIPFSMEQDKITVVSSRASLKFHLGQKLSFDGAFYHKKRNSSSRNQRVGNSDYYQIAEAALKYKLGKKGELKLSYDWYFDNNPYTLTTETINLNDDVLKIGTVNDPASTFKFLTAPDRFKRWSLTVTIPLEDIKFPG